MGGEIGQALDVQRVGAVGAHGEDVRVLETERTVKRDVVFAREPVAELIQHRLTARHIMAMHFVGPQRAGIIDIHIDALAGECVNKPEEKYQERQGAPVRECEGVFMGGVAIRVAAYSH